MKHVKRAKPSDHYLNVLKKRYAKANKKERGVMLDEFVKTTGYHRKHAAAVLSERWVRTARSIRRRRADLHERRPAGSLASG